METPAPAPWVTATTSVLFPRRQWTTLDSKWTLVLTVTAELVWNERQTSPDAGDGPSIFRSDRVAAARVVELVRVGRLWIGTGGRSVDLAVRPTLSGRLIPGGDDEEHLRERLREMLLGWQPWTNELGLRVQDSHAESAGTDTADDGVLHLTVNHPPSSHGLYAPQSDGGIPQAQLRCVACQLDIDLNGDGFKMSPSATPTTHRQKMGNPKSKKKTRLAPKSKVKPPPARRGPRTKPGPAARRRQQQQQEEKSIRLISVLLDDSVAWRKVALLVETALHMLVGTVKAGSSKPRVPGVRPVDKVSMAGGAPGLLDVAPAVWSNGYFMAVSTRAAYVSLIHRCLASFTNAQSPSLRRKAEALAASPESSQSSSQEILLGAKLEEILLKGVQQLQPRTKKAPPLRPPKPVLSEYLPTSPQPSLPPSQESGPSQVNALEFDEEEGCRFIDLTFDNIEAFFSLSPADSQFQEQYFQEAEEEVHEDNDLEVKELGWGDIEAWSEPDYTPEDKDGLLQEIDETWDPEECENEKTGNEGRIGDYYEEEEGAADNDPYGDLSGESGLSLWKEMQADQIDQWLASDDQLMGFDEEYLDDENLHFVDIDMLDLDEGIGLWQNEDNVVDDCC